jgi:hypothetical protein
LIPKNYLDFCFHHIHVRKKQSLSCWCLSLPWGALQFLLWSPILLNPSWHAKILSLGASYQCMVTMPIACDYHPTLKTSSYITRPCLHPNRTPLNSLFFLFHVLLKNYGILQLYLIICWGDVKYLVFFSQYPMWNACFILKMFTLKHRTHNWHGYYLME